MDERYMQNKKYTCTHNYHRSKKWQQIKCRIQSYDKEQYVVHNSLTNDNHLIRPKLISLSKFALSTYTYTHA